MKLEIIESTKMRRVLKIILITTVILGLLVSGISCSKSSIQTPTAPPESASAEEVSPTQTPETTLITQIDYTSPLIIGEDWNNMTLSQKEAWVDTALDAMMIGGELGESERQPAIYYIEKLDEIFYDSSNEKQFVSLELTAFTESTPAPAPTPTPTPTTESVPISKNDFLITIIPNRQVTVTNNSQSTVQVCKSSTTYECYSYVQYNMPGKPSPYYGPIIRPVSTSDESTELKPGQSFSKTIRSSTEVLAIVSCIFYIRDNSTGQTIEVTYN